MKIEGCFVTGSQGRIMYHVVIFVSNWTWSAGGQLHTVAMCSVDDLAYGLKLPNWNKIETDAFMTGSAEKIYYINMLHM